MSAQAAARQPRPVPASAPAAAPRLPEARPRLRVVRAPAPARTRAPFVMLCITVLAGSLLGALLLNTSMAQGEYDRYALQVRHAAATTEQQRIESEIALRKSPAELAAAATALGMVQAEGNGYLRLSDGAVLGNPVPAEAQG
ncbi:hypothetical protein [Actinotalea sp. K2]|uniref:hypothetical protein n=1 Tax=Actinotalea sp. K2 TaxID=2939438 RepID=UPI002017AA78|nr:hypothetical protein [Actinotalea sp. K2]MCL3860128.1 hypothetical protein [Actinotalea sp. K2]